LIIADTSVWVDHFRGLPTLLETEPVLLTRRLLHPFVLGELLLGGLPRDGKEWAQLNALSHAPVADPSEVNAFITWAKLTGTGIGYVDTHLLVAAKMVPNGKVLTRDNKLLAQAERLGVAYQP
jgi:predicted nucleic acid-binding protein